MPLLYLIILEYGGCVHIKSILWSLIKCKFCASPTFVKIFELFEQLKFRFALEILIETGFISTPIAFLFNSFASISVVPPPRNGSNIQSLILEYLKIKFLGTYGDQLPLYFQECVAHLPLSGNSHIVVSSKLI